jgi:proline reductase-associated electron transfer protein PrdC
VIINIPLKQHVGAPSTPLVKANQKVKKGELMATPEGLGANIHSSVYGMVVEVTDSVISIEMDDNQPDEFVKIKDTDTNIEAVKEAGIVGAGGAGFPAHIKFGADLKGGYVLANAAECEPVLGHNVELMENEPETLIKGIRYVMEMTNASKGIIAIKPKYKKAMIEIGKVVKDIEDIEIKFLPDMYPAGDERVIVREILGVELKPGELPSVANAVIANIETLKNVVLAIEDRKPVIEKDITVGGKVKDAKHGRVFMNVPLGMPISKYIEKCGGLEVGHGEIIMGGPFTGRAVTMDASINKTTGGVLVAVEYPQDNRKVGIIACECGAQEERLHEIAKGMGATVVAQERCKRMVEVNGRFRCDLPGSCPGQAEKVLSLKKQGAEIIITGTCED